MIESIEVFGVTLPRKHDQETPAARVYHGQMKESPSLDILVVVRKEYTQMRIEWFGFPFHDRIYLTSHGQDLEEAKKNIGQKFVGMMNGAKMIAGRII